MKNPLDYDDIMSARVCLIFMLVLSLILVGLGLASISWAPWAGGMPILSVVGKTPIGKGFIFWRYWDV